jgi:hypothetical protein
VWCAVCGGARSVPASLPLALTVADHVTPSRTVICARTACQADGFAGSTAGALFGSIQKTAPLSASNKSTHVFQRFRMRFAFNAVHCGCLEHVVK